MIADPDRMAAYAAALRATVDESSVVLDLGAGTGILALLAARLGARRVFAVESDIVIDVAEAIVHRNQLGDRVEVVEGVSTGLRLPEPADVIVSDLRGVLPLYRGHIPALVDARKRLLKPGGTLIPLRDTLWASLVEAPDAYLSAVECWTQHDQGFDLVPAREIAANTWWKQYVEPSQLLTEPQLIAALDYQTIEDPSMTFDFELSAQRDGKAHGLCVWFDAELVEGIGFSNAPGRKDSVYGCAFFPLFESVEMAVEDRAEVLLGASLVEGYYVWRWETRVRRGKQTRAEFRQSTALAMPLSSRRITKSSDRYIPKRGDDGETLMYALGLMDGASSVGEMASRLARRFPERFDQHESLQYVVSLVHRYAS